MKDSLRAQGWAMCRQPNFGLVPSQLWALTRQSDHAVHYAVSVANPDIKSLFRIADLLVFSGRHGHPAVVILRKDRGCYRLLAPGVALEHIGDRLQHKLDRQLRTNRITDDEHAETSHWLAAEIAGMLHQASACPPAFESGKER